MKRNWPVVKCPTCQTDFTTTKGRKKYCSRNCYINSEQYKAQTAQQMEAFTARMKAIKGKLPPHGGTCPVCGLEFRSRRKDKIYCSIKCWSRTDKFKAMCRETSKVIAEAGRASHEQAVAHRPQKPCLNCGQAIGPRGTKYCSRTCYRAFMAERFDRWIANPESIALPQCYDEFLSRDELPCLIEGCDWVGKHLGNHVNFAHGISANDFKVLAGFNLSTGLVTPEVSENLAVKQAALIEKYRQEGRELLNPVKPGECRYPPPSPSNRSNEGAEHSAKSMALAKATAPDRTAVCRGCNVEFTYSGVGRRQYYCSFECRDSYYQKRTWELTCAQCGSQFQ